MTPYKYVVKQDTRGGSNVKSRKTLMQVGGI